MSLKVNEIVEFLVSLITCAETEEFRATLDIFPLYRPQICILCNTQVGTVQGNVELVIDMICLRKSSDF